MNGVSTSKEYARRLGRLQRALARRRLDAMLVFDRANSYYLTGLRASLSYLLVTPREAVLYADGRYIETARAVVGHCEVRLMKSAPEALAQWRGQFKPRTMGFEGSSPWGAVRQWRESIEADWQEAGDLIAELRLIKSPAEARLIADSAWLNDQVYGEALASVRAGQSERELARRIRSLADDAGAERLAFETIVAAGPNSSRPHYEPADQPLAARELLLIDMGLVHGGYCSDMTRVVGLGRRPPARLERVYEAVLEAEEAALAAVAPGVACAELDAIARGRLKARRLANYFSHGLGHGVGLEIHEGPTLNARSKTVLRAGMVVTIEPGVYLPGLGGVRIEDLVLVTRHGHKVLSRTPKGFRTLDL